MPTLNSSLIIEIVQHRQGIVEEWSPNLQDPNLFAKEKEFHQLKLIQTNLLSFICFEYTFDRIENRVLEIETLVQKVNVYLIEEVGRAFLLFQ